MAHSKVWRTGDKMDERVIDHLYKRIEEQYKRTGIPPKEVVVSQQDMLSLMKDIYIVDMASRGFKTLQIYTVVGPVDVVVVDVWKEMEEAFGLS